MINFLTAFALLGAFLLAAALPTEAAPQNSLEVRQGGSLNCFNTCTGVNETIYSQAISSFCHSYDPLIINKDGSDGGYVGVYVDIPYAPTPGTGEEGVMYLEVEGLKDDDCGTVKIDYDTCLYNFYVPINQCNILSKDGKQGGTWYTPCIMFKITPSPHGC